ncbi:hypothetical protein HYH43_13910 [Clostridium botulinum]|uniref:hypothetical protein n=1 Tax=Clostridium botulinum TaxID=1491 RepID=UPI001C9B3B20|nr:hypothetical protein [Clostridium botulinum]MBY6790529.1 hypothetical protein [Clostridium botulinum]NFG76253.1 hypothetical protein [Clostridium botulinum]
MKFPAKYSQLPNYDYEYYKIINEINYRISKSEFENIVAGIKNSRIKDKYKHRTHLENLGLICTENNFVYLSDIGNKINSKQISMEKGLRYLVEENRDLSLIFDYMISINYFKNNISKNKLVEMLHKEIYMETAVSTISRYIIPIINLFYISNLNRSSENEIYKEKQENNNIANLENWLRILERVYLEIGNEYGKVVAIEKIEKRLNSKYKMEKSNIVFMWKCIYNNINLRYKYNLLTLPSWGTRYKGVILGGEIFTHLIINL